MVSGKPTVLDLALDLCFMRDSAHSMGGGQRVPAREGAPIASTDKPLARAARAGPFGAARDVYFTVTVAVACPRVSPAALYAIALRVWLLPIASDRVFHV